MDLMTLREIVYQERKIAGLAGSIQRSNLGAAVLLKYYIDRYYMHKDYIDAFGRFTLSYRGVPRRLPDSPTALSVVPPDRVNFGRLHTEW